MHPNLNQNLLSACVQCGLCLMACPTYQVTRDEAYSPRGRIALMRELQCNERSVPDEALLSIETCIQCRGCEPACPSNVQFGHLMERTREVLANAGRITPWWQRLVFKALSRPGLLRVGTLGLAAVQRLVPLPRGLMLPDVIPLRQARLEFSGEDVYLFTGCVMDAWQRDIHAATKRVLEATGFGVALTGDIAPCCGALHAHAGLIDNTKELAIRMISALEHDRPILVNSAGCGAAMKDCGHLLGTEAGRLLASRVYDIHEWLALHIERLPRVEPLELRVAIQDPCHLRHVQGVHGDTRTVLTRFVSEIVELDDSGLCCGAGGAYALLQPEMANNIRALKIDAITRADPRIVASANPGCSLHLSAAGVPTAHPMELIDRAIRTAGERATLPNG